MSTCVECKHFNTEISACYYNMQEIEHDPDDCACENFIARKECKNKKEEYAGCDIICRSLPSKSGCSFRLICTIDNRFCDEKCLAHELRQHINKEREKLNNLITTRNFINSLIEETQNKLNDLEKTK